MQRPKHISRRRFLVLGGATALSAFTGGAYLWSGCPLSDSGICVGPCAAFLDLDGDGICNRIQRASSSRPSVVHAEEPQPQVTLTPCVGVCQTACPFGLVNDPYPGKCGRYVDRNDDGVCDLSEPLEPAEPAQDVRQAVTPTPVAPTPTAEPGPVRVACPFGLVNDPYPGKCGRYVDRNGNGICDLSEPGAPAEPPQDSPQPVAPTPAVPTPTLEPDPVRVACPFGLVNDPYPGKCGRYVDRNGNGICDLSEPDSGTAEPDGPAESQQPVAPTPVMPTTEPEPVRVACPFGLVNDPYPGKCGRYVDRNGNGICDLSEPDSGTGEGSPDGSRQRRGRGRGSG